LKSAESDEDEEVDDDDDVDEDDNEVDDEDDRAGLIVGAGSNGDVFVFFSFSSLAQTSCGQPVRPFDLRSTSN
jgi:hypothetical protein